MLETADPPLIDEAELAQSLDSLGEERLVPILQAFAATVVGEAGDVVNAASAHEPDRARRMAHAIKGAAFNLSATRLARAAEAVEKMDASADLSPDAPLFAQLTAAARETGDWIALRFPELIRPA
ncbi:Hpt domain-containing protein [Novosphingobium sp. BL-8A]|uniref:Hpt domain-containing protein n=1 Tax=Novosphingobium sp. BL-8A TaxID=3127639 RepID=UPI0037570D20